MIEVKNVSKEFTKITNKKEKIKFKADDDTSFSANSGDMQDTLSVIQAIFFFFIVCK